MGPTWTELNQSRKNRLNRTEYDQIGKNRTKLDRIGPNWSEENRINQIGPNSTKLDQNKTTLDRRGQWTELDQSGLNKTNMD